MPKTVSVFIPNHNSYEMIELCVRSIRHFTRYPNYKIVVHDDYSYTRKDGEMKPNMVDLNFLRKARDKGWLELHEHSEPPVRHHGGSLTFLINEICDTDYAVLIDCDIQIKDYDWITDLVDMAEADPKIIAIMETVTDGGFSSRCYRAPNCFTSLGLLNMHAYRDGMQVDWHYKKMERKYWPQCEELKDFYPPENCKYTEDFLEKTEAQRKEFDAESVIFDPGASFAMQVKYKNPKGYKLVVVPRQILDKHFHYGHISMLAPRQKKGEGINKEELDEKFAVIRQELHKLKKLMSE